MSSKTMERLSPWIVTLVCIVIWEIGVRLFDVPAVVLPTASSSSTRSGNSAWRFGTTRSRP